MAYPQTSFSRTTIDVDSLVGKRRQAVSKTTLLYQLKVLKETGRYDAFKLKWHPTYDEPPLVWPIPNHLFWDSDVAKWIEGACYFLKQQKSPEIDAAIHELVQMIRGAQQTDGYLNIHYTVVGPGERFTNLKDMHELYNLGHLIEAALAHNDLYQNDDLLEPIVKYVDLISSTFGPQPDQRHGYPGHPEIELALLRLYDRTRSQPSLKLARYFITERGNPKGMHGKHYFDWEAVERGAGPHEQPSFYPEPHCLWYHQAHQPIASQTSIEGHSVRAVYLLTAVADLLRIEPYQDHHGIHQALYRLWDNMVDRKMYVTGGIGSMTQWEGFGRDFFLPQGTDEGGCYAETCAAIGVMMLAQRLLQIELDARFGDIMELCLYNAVLTAMSHDGKAFTYVNQLASSDENPSQRSDWFTVACCPPNIMRLLGQIGGYVWDTHSAERRTMVTVNLYIPSTLSIPVNGKTIELKQSGDWPWNDTIRFDLSGEALSDMTMKLRIPQWAREHRLEPPCADAIIEKGYFSLPGPFLAHHQHFTLTIPLVARWVAPHPLVEQDTVSLVRGPVVYCVEDFDNAWVQDHFKNTFVDTAARLTETMTTDEKSGDRYVSIVVQDGARRLPTMDPRASPGTDLSDLVQQLDAGERISKLSFVPYCLRANRGGRGQMRVGLRRYPR